MSTLGTVTALDRANRVVRATLDDGSEVEAGYFPSRRRRPWPLGRAVFEERLGVWACRGPVGDRRVLLAEDFGYVESASGTGVLDVDCDTPWRFNGGGATGGSVAQSNPGDAQGVAALIPANASDNAALYKGATTINPSPPNGPLYLGDPPAALWLSARVRGTSVTSGNLWVGLSPLTGVNARAGVRFDPTGTGRAELFTRDLDDVADNTYVAGTTPAVDTWYWFELVVTEGFVAGWIDGDGPYVRHGNFADYTWWPYLFVNRGLAAPAWTMYVDCCHVEHVTPVVDGAAYAVS